VAKKLTKDTAGEASFSRGDNTRLAGKAMRSGKVAPMTFGVNSEKTMIKKVMAPVASSRAVSLLPN
jgi:hypothetical protein